MIEALNYAFKDIKYLDSGHRYFCGDQELKSITKFLSSLKEEFNSTYWSIYKAYQFSGYTVKMVWNNRNYFWANLPDEEPEMIMLDSDHSHLQVTPSDVLKQWALDNVIGTTRGTYVHNYLENLENRIIDVPEIVLIPNMSTSQAINYVNSLQTARELCQSFVTDIQKTHTLVASEFIVGSPKLELAGTFDRLYFNRETKQYEIWDFKTDKKFRSKGEFGNKIKTFDVPDCEFEKYSLQVSLYRKIIEDALGIKLGESRVVWFDFKNKEYSIVQCNNYVQLITSKL